MGTKIDLLDMSLFVTATLGREAAALSYAQFRNIVLNRILGLIFKEK